MKKGILVLAMMGFSLTAIAKGGGSDPIKLEFKNSQAGFVSESLEHTLRLFTNTHPDMKDKVEDASVVSQSLDNSVVTISLNDGSAVTYTCVRFDDFSNSGTILKKEVVCQAK